MMMSSETHAEKSPEEKAALKAERDARKAAKAAAIAEKKRLKAAKAVGDHR